MSSDDNRPSNTPEDREPHVNEPLTRRGFLKVAGVAGAAVGMSGGLGGVLAACGSSSPSTSSSGATGREIKVGFVAPLTGPLAAFGEADAFCVDQWRAAVKDGLKTADGTTHPVTIIVRDSQSDSNRAATVAGDLITNNGVDFMMTASTSDTVNPVADQAEALGVPCFSSDSPWQNFYFGRGATPAKPFQWTYHAFWGVETNSAVQLDIWRQLPTNKIVGLMCGNDADGLALANPKTGLPFFFTKGGYKVVDAGRFPDGSQDFTTEITKFKNAGCQIVSGVMIPPDFVNFWKQCHQQGFQPKIVTMPKALLFPSVLEAMGPIGYGLTCELWWSPVYPYKSSLSGQTCQQLADAFTAATKKQWVQPIMHYVLFEVVADALKRATSIDDKQALVDALKATNLATVAGTVNFTAGGANNPVPNVSVTPLAGGQWEKGTQYPFEIMVVSNSQAPQVPIQQKPHYIKY
jgi:branched-chain amino acid transport system substrate-binding protein